MQTVPATTSIWSFQRRLTHRLMRWAIPSVVVGGLLAWRGRTPAQRAIGQQAVAWGAIDAAIALGGQSAAERKQATAMPVDEIAQARSLRRLLWLNTALDVLYVTGGLALARSQRGDAARGHGIGIIIQGGFLLFFDLIHARKVPRLDPPERAAATTARAHT
ncbi:MAG: DUF6992 family protein [Caldilineaceae bacterium]